MHKPQISVGLVDLCILGQLGWSEGLSGWLPAWLSGYLWQVEKTESCRGEKREAERDAISVWNLKEFGLRGDRITWHPTGLHYDTRHYGGTVIEQWAANDVLKVKLCAGLMGPEGPAVLDAVMHKNASDKS